MRNFRLLTFITINIAVYHSKLLVTSADYTPYKWIPVPVPPARSRGRDGVNEEAYLNIHEHLQSDPQLRSLIDVNLDDHLSLFNLKEPTLLQMCKSIKTRFGNDAPSEPIFKRACDSELAQEFNAH